MYFANGHKSVSICTLFGFSIQIGLLERVAGEAESEPHLRTSVSRSSHLSSCSANLDEQQTAVDVGSVARIHRSA
jgi:hypothetical protein